MNVRTAQLKDSLEIARLITDLGYAVSQPEIESRLTEILSSERHYVGVVGRGAELLGCIAAEHRLLLESGERIEIVALIVDSAARRQGIGAVLVAAAEAWAATRGQATVFVRSNVARDESHEFYPSIGYERAKTQHAYVKRI